MVLPILAILQFRLVIRPKSSTNHALIGWRKRVRRLLTTNERSLDSKLIFCFTKGHIIKANADIINTVGGLPRYIGKVLNNAAKREAKRRNTPIKQQLDFMF